MLDLRDDGFIKLSVLVDTHLLGVGVLWSPFGGCSWRSLLQHSVDLFECEPLGLWDEKVSVKEASSAERSPEEEDLRFEVSLGLADKVWGDDGNDTVPQPVGSSGESDTSRSDWQREDLSNDDPGTWSPSRCKEEDVNGDEGNLCIDSRVVVGVARSVRADVSVVESNSDTNNSNDEFADEHTESTVDQNRSSSETLYHPEREWSGANVDQSEDEGDKESVADCVSRLEERSRVVEDEVHTSPLLHHLHGGSENRLSHIRGRLE